MKFDADCRLCPRLAAYLDEVRSTYPDYYARPVAPFGAARPSLLIVGLAPGLHGANATGRPFTGDHAGILLYQTLHEFGFSNRPASRSRSDGLKLRGCRITNAVKCVPPQNKPTGTEITTCNVYLRHELSALPHKAVVLALGAIAHRAVLQALGRSPGEHPFGHGRVHDIGSMRLVDSYHCSRYNTQTGRLTSPMFHQVFETVRRLLHP